MLRNDWPSSTTYQNVAQNDIYHFYRQLPPGALIERLVYAWNEWQPLIELDDLLSATIDDR
jgi:hypothetical protein